jgi:superfamily II DNA/RNA helicase
MDRQTRELRQRPNVVIGTPGRLKDHMSRGNLKLNEFNVVVLDEVDRMLDMGFVDDMREILAELAPQKQSFFFSATMDARVQRLIGDFSDNPEVISVKTGDTTDNVEQDAIKLQHGENKLDRLHDILMGENINKVLVFDDTQRRVEKLSDDLMDRGFKADSIHGGKSQSQRQRALKRFKDGNINILVATDVAARGIDVPDVTHVINYSSPQSYSDYVHRIGRAGRAGKKGWAITIVD